MKPGCCSITETYLISLCWIFFIFVVLPNIPVIYCYVTFALAINVQHKEATYTCLHFLWLPVTDVINTSRSP